MSFYVTYWTIGWIICLAMVPIILQRDLAPGASLAWLLIVFIHPYIGFALYLLVGESRLGPRRSSRHREIMAKFRAPDRLPQRKGQSAPAGAMVYQPMANQAEKIGQLGVLFPNQAHFYAKADEFLERLVAEIESAKSNVNLLYYMFAGDTTGNRVADALLAATQRGVQCRVLADAMASRPFFRHDGLGPRLQAGGVKIAAALPVTPFRRRLARMDLRNHRKLAVIDDRVAFMGSHNLINPDYGGRRGNPWFDVTGRFTGPIVAELASVFAEDWAFETGDEIPLQQTVETGENLADALPAFAAQTVPTGPSTPGLNYRRLLLGAIQCAQKKLLLTSPYFVPDQATIMSLTAAADRGVEVTIVLPQTPDHFFTAAAGRAHFQKLLVAGIKIFLFRPGLLHAKTTTVDDLFCVFGSANLDVRSFELNFELTTDKGVVSTV